MAKMLGRKVILKRGTEPVANIRTKELQINRELADATDENSDGWAEHVTEAAQLEVTMSVEGVLSDLSIMDRALNPTLGDETYTLEYPDGSTISADFGLTSFSESDTYNDVTTYSFEIRANGTVTRTAA